MYFKSEEYSSDLEVIYTRSNLVTEGTTILSDGVTADSHGKKYVVQGSLIDVTGKVVTEKKSGETYILSADPVGILYRTVNVTEVNQPGTLIIEGYVRADRTLGDYPNTADIIKTKLLEIKFK